MRLRLSSRTQLGQLSPYTNTPQSSWCRDRKKKNGRTSRRQYYRISYDFRRRKNAFSWYSVTSDIYSFQDVSVNLICSFSRLFLFSFSETKCCFPSVVGLVLVTQPRLVQAHSRYSCLSARIIGVCLSIYPVSWHFPFWLRLRISISNFYTHEKDFRDLLFLFFWGRVSMYLKLAWTLTMTLNSYSSCLPLPNTGITDMQDLA